jgi:predicted dithiol-disulfide oxidoreductase (DUF899 family)
MNDIEATEKQIGELIGKLRELRARAPRREVPDYTFRDSIGEVRLSELFVGRDRLFAIHNMGQGCRYCTLWADGFNSFVQHLESNYAVVLLSKDAPDVQRRFANSRQWRFRMASHGGGDYIREQSVSEGGDNMPGIVLYEKDGGKIYRKNSSVFGPGDLFCSHWHILSLAGHGEEDWTPQYNYWKRPESLDDGGQNLL